MDLQSDVLAGKMDLLEVFIVNWVNKRLDTEITDNTNFFDNGYFDSLVFAELIVCLEQEYKIEINFYEGVDWVLLSSPIGLASYIRGSK